MAKLKKPLNFQELIGQGTEFEIEPVEENDEISDEDNKDYDQLLSNFANLECLGQFNDEDVYKEGEPFQTIAEKMTDVLPNGDIKKRVLRKGYGECPEDNTVVKIHYNAYIEYNADPFDSTYARKHMLEFKINGGRVLPGLDIAVQSMKLNEKSQFLIKPNFAYGSIGCLNRIPPNSTILFEIELVEKIEAGAADTYEYLPEDKQKQFEEVYKYCTALCIKGKDLFKKNIRDAIKNYNKAVGKLEYVAMENYEEEEKQQELLMKLYTNLLVCYTKTEQPKKACINFNKISNLTKGTDLKISAKVFYNNARCLRMLGEYDLAKSRLMIAHKMEPKNTDILAELKLLDDKKKEYMDKEKNIAKAFVAGNSGSSSTSN